MRKRTILLLVMSIFSMPTAHGNSLPSCEKHVAAAARKHSVPLAVLYAVGLTETGRNGTLHPHALNLEGKPYFASSAQDAVIAFKSARDQGLRLIDVGCMQINHHFHGEHFNSLEDMLDPRQNVTYAAQFLSRLKTQEGSWTRAIARYHAGAANHTAHKVYICRVIGNLVVSGFGVWTAEALEYCK